MNVSGFDLGYREIERLGAFLMRCSHDSNIYNKLNDMFWSSDCGNVYIGYDLKRDTPYISNGRVKYFECDL